MIPISIFTMVVLVMIYAIFFGQIYKMEDTIRIIFNVCRSKINRYPTRLAVKFELLLRHPVFCKI